MPATDGISLGVLLASSVILLIAYLSGFVGHSFISRPTVALAWGVLFGPLVFNLVHIPTNIQFLLLEGAARFSLAISLMGTALYLPREDVPRRIQATGALLSLGMIGMWAAGTALTYAILRIPLLEAALVAGALTPTDPVLARTISEGTLAEKFVPSRIRYTLLGESALNDGLAFPFVYLPLTLLLGLSLTRYWLLYISVQGVVGGAILGIILGYVAGKLLMLAQKVSYIERAFFLAFATALALMSVTLGQILGVNGVLTVAVTGLMFRLSLAREDKSDMIQVQSIIDLLFTLPIFFILGLMIPWDGWLALGWRGPVLLIALLVARRLPVVLALRPLLKKQLYTWGETAFVGWFGPTGVSALFYVALIMEQTGIEELWAIVSLIVVGSVVVFGVSASPLVKLLGKLEGPISEPQTGAREE